MEMKSLEYLGESIGASVASTPSFLLPSLVRSSLQYSNVLGIEEPYTDFVLSLGTQYNISIYILFFWLLLSLILGKEKRNII